jgi:hypothetical protein
MEQLNELRPFNHRIEGRTDIYDCWEIRPSTLNLLEGKNVLCLAYYMTLPRKYHLFYAKFFEDFRDFQGVYFKQIVYSFCIIPVHNVFEATKIIGDITN